MTWRCMVCRGLAGKERRGLARHGWTGRLGVARRGSDWRGKKSRGRTGSDPLDRDSLGQARLGVDWQGRIGMAFMKYRDKLLEVLDTQVAYSLEQLRKRCTGSPEHCLEVTLALDQLRYAGLVECIEGAYRLVRKPQEKQRELWG